MSILIKNAAILRLIVAYLYFISKTHLNFSVCFWASWSSQDDASQSYPCFMLLQFNWISETRQSNKTKRRKKELSPKCQSNQQRNVGKVLRKTSRHVRGAGGRQGGSCVPRPRRAEKTLLISRKKTTKIKQGVNAETIRAIQIYDNNSPTGNNNNNVNNNKVNIQQQHPRTNTIQNLFKSTKNCSHIK